MYWENIMVFFTLYTSRDYVNLKSDFSVKCDLPYVDLIGIAEMN